MNKSFTLIELIVVIAIIAILAAIIAPNAFRVIEKAKISKTVSDMRTVKVAAQSYYADSGKWPWEGAVHGEHNNNGTGFMADDGVSGWDGPYLESWPKSQWTQDGLEFVYVYYPLGDWDNDGTTGDHFISIRNSAGFSTALSEDIKLKIDSIIDDGNLSTGRVQTLPPNNLHFDYFVVK